MRLPGSSGFRSALLLVLGSLVASWNAGAAQQPVRVAAAANFKQTADRLAQEFSKQTGELPPTVSAGATGVLYGQIVQGAPFDLFFAADRERPAQLEAAGLAVPGSRFTYALGKLVLWRPGRVWSGTLEEALRSEDVKVVSIASPSVAPYGAAAQQVLDKLRLWSSPPFKIVQGESLGQAFQFVATGNAQLGFVALSQVIESKLVQQRPLQDEVLEIDPTLYGPIAQDAVRLARSNGNPAVDRFLAFVRSPRGRAIIVEAGYAAGP